MTMCSLEITTKTIHKITTGDKKNTNKKRNEAFSLETLIIRLNDQQFHLNAVTEGQVFITVKKYFYEDLKKDLRKKDCAWHNSYTIKFRQSTKKGLA